MKRLVVLVGTFLVFMATVALAQNSTALPRLTLISNVNVFNSKTKKLSEGMHVLVKDNLIETVSAEPLVVVQTDTSR